MLLSWLKMQVLENVQNMIPVLTKENGLTLGNYLHFRQLLPACKEYLSDL